MSSIAISTIATPAAGEEFIIDAEIIGLTGAADIFATENGLALLTILDGVQVIGSLEVPTPVPAGSSFHVVTTTAGVVGTHSYRASLSIDAVEIGLIQIFSGFITVVVSNVSSLKWAQRISAIER